MNVKIVSGARIGTKVLTEGGVEIEGVRGIVFRAEVDRINRAELDLYVAEIQAEGVASIFVRGKEVRRIEYADGSTDEFPAS